MAVSFSLVVVDDVDSPGAASWCHMFRGGPTGPWLKAPCYTEPQRGTAQVPR